MWTRFMDMNSGGGSKEEWEYIYIEAPEDEAKVIFYNRFGHNPERVTCTCCGRDYSIDSEEKIVDLQSAYEAGCVTLLIKASEIKDSERSGDIPEQGYVWQD